MDEVAVTDVDDGLGAVLHGLIDRFNEEATGFRDGRWLRAAVHDDAGELVAGLSGWTWGGCGYVETLWVRSDRRGQGLGSRLLAAAEAEATVRGCAQMVLSTHSFQAPGFYAKRGYVEFGRVDGYPRGHAAIHLVKRLGSSG